MRTPFNRALGTKQGRIKPTDVVPFSGEYVFCLGYDEPGWKDFVTGGDFALVEQKATFRAGTKLLRVRTNVRPPSSQPPTGFKWVLEILLDDVIRVSADLVPGGRRRERSFAINVSKVSAGSHYVTVRLRFVPTAPAQIIAQASYECGFYPEQLVYDDAAYPISSGEVFGAAHMQYAQLVSGASVFTSDPSKILANLLHWYRADQGVALDGSNNVSQWNDLVGIAHLVQATAGSRPAYNATDAAYNNTPTLQATTVGQFLAVASLTINQAFTVWLVGEQTNNGQVLVGFGTPFVSNSGGALIYAGNVAVNSGVSNATKKSLLSIFNGASSFVGADNWVSGGTSGNAGPTNGTALGVFARSASGNNAVLGKIAELIIQAGIPTAAEKANMAAYFATRYGITVLTTDPTVNILGAAKLISRMSPFGITSLTAIGSGVLLPKNTLSPSGIATGAALGTVSVTIVPGLFNVFEGPMLNGMRLTTESGVPVSSSDRTAQSTLYFTPFTAGYIALYNTGTSAWVARATGEVSLALSGLTSGKNYDVFAYWTGSAVALELSAAWTDDTNRATALAKQNGIYVKSGDATRRYVGTIRATAATTIEDSKAKRFVWNGPEPQRQVPRVLRTVEATASWSGTTSYAQVRAQTTNQVEFVAGLPTPVTCETTNMGQEASGTGTAQFLAGGIGLDSATTQSAQIYVADTAIQPTSPHVPNSTAISKYDGTLTGYHSLKWLERDSNFAFTSIGGTASGARGQLGIAGIQGRIRC